MLDNLFPNLATLIITVKRNMLSSVVTTLMIITIIVVWSARGNFEQWVNSNPSPTEQTARLVRANESDIKIENALRTDLEAVGADRVLIRRFSTGEVPVSVSITHLVAAPGVSMLSASNSSIPRSFMGSIVASVFADAAKPSCVKVNIGDITDDKFRALMEDAGVEDIYTCPIIDIDGAPLGLISAHYLTSTKPRPSDEVILNTLDKTGVRVAGYISDIVSPNKNWFNKIFS